MKTLTFISILTISIFTAKAQEFDLVHVEKVSKTINWQPAKLLKDLSADDLHWFFMRYNSETAAVKQLNIEAWGVCDYHKTDNLGLYNYYYNDISRDTYNKYCREISVLMLLDNVINQSK